MEKNSECSTNFGQDRKIGENESTLCQIIRSDSLNDFILYLNKHLISTRSKIKQSIFETNSYLIKNSPYLIDYSAFFGSLNIFKYLISNGAKLNPSLWLSAIHGQNIEIIKILEKSSINLNEKSYTECLKEAIKCHHNNIAKYIIDNFFNGKKIDDDVFATSLKYCNFHFFPNEINEKLFYNLCKYNYAPIIENILKYEQLDVNSKVILKKKFLSSFKNCHFFHRIFLYKFFLI